MTGVHQCSRFNTDVESTLAQPMKEKPVHSIAKCPNNATTTHSCSSAVPFAYPPWVIEAEARNRRYMDEVVKCHPR